MVNIFYGTHHDFVFKSHILLVNYIVNKINVALNWYHIFPLCWRTQSITGNLHRRSKPPATCSKFLNCDKQSLRSGGIGLSCGHNGIAKSTTDVSKYSNAMQISQPISNVSQNTNSDMKPTISINVMRRYSQGDGEVINLFVWTYFA